MRDTPKSQSFNLASLAERKMFELRRQGHRNVLIFDSGNGSIRIKSTAPEGETVITEISINKPVWLKDYFAIRNSVNRTLRNLNRSAEISLIPENFGDGAAFGPSQDSALLYLNRFAANYPENGEDLYGEPLFAKELDNGGNPGVNDHSALLIIKAMTKKVGQNGSST